MQEFLLSYKLLFAASPGARKSWRRKERVKASEAAGGLCDAMLEKLCGSTDTVAQDSRLSYSMANDFPIFAQRLQGIQDDILRQQPNRLSALWNDLREPLRCVYLLGRVGDRYCRPSACHFSVRCFGGANHLCHQSIQCVRL